MKFINEELMQALEIKYNETLKEFEEAEDTLKVRLIKRDHFIQNLHGILGIHQSTGQYTVLEGDEPVAHTDSYTYWNSKKSCTFIIDKLGDFEEKQVFLNNVHDQICSQLS